jgi:hypothetical protein
MAANTRFRTNGPLVVGVFHQRGDLDEAIAALRAAGFANDQIGVVARNEDDDWNLDEDIEPAASDASTGAAAGAAAGAGVGGLWALGIAAGMLPAIGPVVAGGILGSVIASAATGAVVGGLSGALIGLGMSEADARYYEDEVSAGRMVLTVRSENREEQVRSILREHGATNVRVSQTEHVT